MLANMPTTTTTTGIGNINSLTSIEPGQCIPFNFLKRKLNVEEHQQSEQISNQNSAFQGSTIMGGDGNSWKKRHMDDVIQATTTSATTAATKTATCFDENSLQEELMNLNAHKNANINGNNNNNNNANINNQNINNENNNNNHLIIHNDNNNNNSNTNELQFSLSNSAFINDLFSYDNNLIVPVSISTTSIDQNVTIASSTIPLTTEASNVNAQFVANDDANWQATDLLELDHRYNSTLQVVEEAVVTTTTNGNTMPPSTSSTTPTVMHQLNPTLPTQHQQVQQHFLIPQKQIMRSQQMLNRYRQHYQQQQQQHQHEQHIVLHLQHQPQQPEQQQQQLHQSQQLQLQSQQHLQQSQQHLQQSQQLHSPQQQQPHHSQHQQSLNYINSPSQQLQQSQQEIMQSQHQQQQHQQQHQQQQQHHQQQQQQQPQHHQSSDSESDFEDKNLSWLLNFKFDEFPHLSPDIGNSLNRSNIMESNVGTDPEKPPQTRSLKGNANSPASTSSPATSERSRSKSPKTSTSKASKKFEELVMEVTASECDGNDMIIGENVVVEDFSAKTQKKPPFTYTELIEYALEDKGELTVSGIYQWISDRFPFYKSNDDRWKNSVRHNLSINPHFRKGSKAPQGAGHLWTISSGDSAENVLAWEHKKQRLELFFKMESMNRERIQEYQQKLQKQQQQQQQQQQQLQQQHNQILSQTSHPEQQHCSTYSPLHQQCQSSGQCLYDEAATAAAAITQEMLQQSTTTTTSISPNTSSLSLGGSSVESGNVRDLRHGFNELHSYNDLMSDEELRKTAGQILNGIHREVEVQSVNSIISTYHDVLLDTDYLNPIHKDVAVNESGLRNTCHNQSTSQYYITEIDPIELGIQMSHQVEEEVLFSDEFNLNYFGYNPSNDIVA